jgi:hypothetical protein
MQIRSLVKVVIFLSSFNKLFKQKTKTSLMMIFPVTVQVMIKVKDLYLDNQNSV